VRILHYKKYGLCSVCMIQINKYMDASIRYKPTRNIYIDILDLILILELRYNQIVKHLVSMYYKYKIHIFGCMCFL
jgi:hypothetical protein